METVSPSPDFPKLETEVLSFWAKNQIFKKSLDIRANSPQYMFYDGPPFATGTPHYGHLLAGTIKDIIPRYQSMKGHFVERRFGWDTHGLPIEMLTEQELGLHGRTDILAYGIAEFNEACRSGVFRYVDEWERVTTRIGRWVDFENDYKTLDTDFMDSVWWVFSELWNRGRVYEGTRVMPYSWRLGTPLSNFEASSNYKDVQDPAITVRFKMQGEENLSILAWTTTPWTTVSNTALCVGPELDYVRIKTADERLILAKGRLKDYFKDSKSYQIEHECKGKDLVGLTYEPLFNFFEDARKEGAFRVVSDSYVTTDDGTGVVHQSPAHGEDDHRIGKTHGVPLRDPVDREGNFDEQAPEFQGQNIKVADKNIIKSLKKKGLLFKQDVLTHSYPFCERSDTPLIYKAISAWYVKVEDLRDQMVANNASIHWVPEHIKDGRFGKWLANARDWNISRNRFWGNPLPIWRCESCQHTHCVASRAELEEKCKQEVPDLHKHFVDKLTFSCEKCSGQMTRVPEVLDCWFESGSMPYAQLHYPFENKERFEKVFPAQFIAEGLDQTRGWFYTLMVLSTAIFEKAPFQNCIVNGMILAQDGKKMSKRLKNYPDPMKVVEAHGADGLRLFLINSPVVKGESLRFSEAGVRDIVRSVLLPFWNVYSFFTTYADVDNFKPSSDLTSPKNSLDRWIISRFQTLLANIEREMDQYRLYTVVPVLLEFLEELTNWYVRRSRRRFWADSTEDKQDGYNTLYFILLGFSRALAPFLPFVTEVIYRNLRTLSDDLPESVHLTDYPVREECLQDLPFEKEMTLIQISVGLGRSLESAENLKTRQPLQSITVVTRNKGDADVLKRFEVHILEELNVKEVLFSDDEANLVKPEVKPNFKILGPRFGKRMGEVAALCSKLEGDVVNLLEDGSVEILGESLAISDFDIRRKSSGDRTIETAKGVTVFFDTTLTPQLLSEGHAREFVNRVQRMRKDADFHIADRIKVAFNTEDELAKSVSAHAEYIQDETLALELTRLDDAPKDGELIESHTIEELSVTISVSR